MKLKQLLVVFLIVIWPQTGSASLITNGDFSADFTGWSTSGNNIIDPTGDNEARIGQPGADVDSSIWQDFFIAPSATALNIGFEYLFALTPHTGPVYDIFTATLDYTTTTGINSVTLVTDTSAGPFSLINYSETILLAGTIDGTSPNATITFSLIESLTTGVGTRIELDDVVIDLVPIPVPASVVLMGFGLAGLAVTRRKGV